MAYVVVIDVTLLVQVIGQMDHIVSTLLIVWSGDLKVYYAAI